MSFIGKSGALKRLAVGVNLPRVWENGPNTGPKVPRKFPGKFFQIKCQKFLWHSVSLLDILLIFKNFLWHSHPQSLPSIPNASPLACVEGRNAARRPSYTTEYTSPTTIPQSGHRNSGLRPATWVLNFLPNIRNQATKKQYGKTYPQSKILSFRTPHLGVIKIDEVNFLPPWTRYIY